MFNWIPESASDLAVRVDSVFLFVTAVSVFFFLLISIVLIYFAIKYRRRSENEETPYITGHMGLEVVWTIIPSILLLFFFAWGYIEFKNMRVAPEDAVDVNVVAKKWLWEFEYYNGMKTVNELYVQKDRPVRMVMMSEDVIHSFFVPQFRVKQDILPGMYTQLWFTPTKVGTFDLYCAEYCGAGHSRMLAKVHVLSPESYARWFREAEIDDVDEDVTPTAERGEQLFAQRGCTACHSVDGTPGVGPTMKGLFGKEREMESGKVFTADENYIRNMILQPDEEIVKGYPRVMPSFRGILSDNEITSIIEYIKTLN